MIRPRRKFGTGHLACLLAFTAGCGRDSENGPDNGSGRVGSGRVGREAKGLISSADRQHDFGAVIGRPGRTMEHRYRLSNATARPVEILQVVNRKRCCGIVRADRMRIEPGGTASIDLTLVVGDKIGPVVHEAEVVTDCPTEESIVLRTTALASPAFRVEELSSAGDAPIFAGGEPRRVELRAIVAGDAAEPPADLGRASLRSTVAVTWLGGQESEEDDGGLRVRSRRLAAMLDAEKLGRASAEILILDGEKILLTHAIRWEVVSPISSSPKVIVMKAEGGDLRASLHSRDKAPFRIVNVDCDAAGVEPRPQAGPAALVQTIRFDGAPRGGPSRGVISVTTDHPAQKKVEIPYVVMD